MDLCLSWRVYLTFRQFSSLPYFLPAPLASLLFMCRIWPSARVIDTAWALSGLSCMCMKPFGQPGICVEFIKALSLYHFLNLPIPFCMACWSVVDYNQNCDLRTSKLLASQGVCHQDVYRYSQCHWAWGFSHSTSEQVRPLLQWDCWFPRLSLPL